MFTDSVDLRPLFLLLPCPAWLSQSAAVVVRWERDSFPLAVTRDKPFTPDGLKFIKSKQKYRSLHMAFTVLTSESSQNFSRNCGLISSAGFVFW